ncbi:MAG: thermonuclease family protein [Bacteroidota bacterium]|nr:thermonuclease family protein [Kiloniellaceae bacterium]
MNALRLLFVAFWLLMPALPAAGTPAAERAEALGLEHAAGGEAVAVVDGDTLVLADGREVRLVGIQAPKLPLGRAGFEPWPLAEEAKARLAAVALGRHLDLGYGGRRGDRHGRVLAHLFDADGRWIQGELLAAGLARVYSFADNRAAVPQMLALERAARAAGRGIWADPFYAVRGAEAAEDWLGGFELVEGRVQAVGQGGGRVYLNFAEDWRQDFTLALDRRALALFQEAGLDPAGLAGKQVRARGWLKSYNGPMIDVTHPEQIEVLEE